MGTRDITWLGLTAAYATLGVSVLLLRLTGVRLYRDLLLAVARMSLQLALVGVYLTFLFQLNHPLLNLAWVLVMTGVANLSLLQGTGLRLSFFIHTFPALLFTVVAVLAFFMTFVLAPDPPLDARYLIPVAGMLLGNSMNRTIITVERFYSKVRSDPEEYLSALAVGATVQEATAPYLAAAYRAGLTPQLASMATIGLVFLPGMMTGQILGGSSPLVAIKYQVAIIIAIYVATELASVLTIRLSLRGGFDDYGFLRREVFKPTAGQ